MRYVALALLLTACSRGDDARDREIAELKAKLATVPTELESARRQGVAQARSEALAKVVEPLLKPPSEAFAEAVERDPAKIARWLGIPVSSFLNQSGFVEDPATLATKVRAAALKQYGKRALDVLVQPDAFGNEVGSAVFYEKIK